MLSILKRFAACTRGGIGLMTAILAPILIGIAGLGVELGYWQAVKNSMQGAADGAAISAGIAYRNGESDWANQGCAVAAQNGWSGTCNTNNACTPGTTAQVCVNMPPVNGQYTNTTNSLEVVVSRSQSSAFAWAVGYGSNTGIEAHAVMSGLPVKLCLLTLATTGTGIQCNGCPSVNLNGCNVQSDSSATCNGHNLNAGIGAAVGTDSGCGNTQISGAAPVADPYSGYASNIPANTCSSYPQEPTKHNPTPLPSSNQWTGTETVSSSGTIICGDLQLIGNTTVSTPAAGGILVIENGQLDLNGFTLNVASGSSLTVIFSGTNGGGYIHAPTDNSTGGTGVLNINAPTSGNWSGVAIYQDPSLTAGVNIASAGNAPTWEISGLVYVPHSNVAFSGAVSKSSNGASCFVLVANTVQLNGTGDIFQNDTQCATAGLNQVEGAKKLQIVE